MLSSKKSATYNEKIYYSINQCSLGNILIAHSEQGICAILLSDDSAELTMEFKKRFPKAEGILDDKKHSALTAKIIKYIEAPKADINFPLDIRGTVFEQKVWQQLQSIPFGKTATYSSVAKNMGIPKAFRAIANACGANSIAILIPCHRVIGSNGSLSGYRWGVTRKNILLEREAAI